MTVRVWMRPSELGEAGYHVDFDAETYSRLKSGALHLLRDCDDNGVGNVVGRVEAGRWDAALLLEEEAADE